MYDQTLYFQLGHQIVAWMNVLFEAKVSESGGSWGLYRVDNMGGVEDGMLGCLVSGNLN